jgi:CubicO group peptidase (beta-lactamase class C family)
MVSRDRATGEELTPDHRFRVASRTKSVIASIVLQLVQEGEIALSDTVEDWLPGMLPENAGASIEDLLRLQSGIFSYDEDERHMAPYLAGDFDYTRLWQRQPRLHGRGRRSIPWLTRARRQATRRAFRDLVVAAACD